MRFHKGGYIPRMNTYLVLIVALLLASQCYLLLYLFDSHSSTFGDIDSMLKSYQCLGHNRRFSQKPVVGAYSLGKLPGDNVSLSQTCNCTLARKAVPITGQEKTDKIPQETEEHKGFKVFVYEIGEEWNRKLQETPIRWWSDQYEPELEIFKMFAELNTSRTWDPEEATLFYVPILSARYTLLHHTEDTPNKLKEAVDETSRAWIQILTIIKEQHPYFSRFNGRDHFSVLSMDHGRCTALTFCDPSMYGSMFFFQLNGDKMVRSSHAVTSRGMQALTYNFNQTGTNNWPDIPCYMADRDIIVPPISSVTKVTKPQETVRDIKVLFRFSAGQHHGVPIPHFNHFIRKELIEMYTDQNYEGWSMEAKSEWDTRMDWTKSIFCICPPGHSQWTSRPVKSIISGCIPVNFYRDHDYPWQDDLDYSRFSVNIDPDELHTLKDVLDSILSSQEKLLAMQRALEAIQDSYLWGVDNSSGARAHVLKLLRRKALLFNR